MMELGPLVPRIGVRTVADVCAVGGWMTAREVKPLAPTTGVKTIEEICAAADIWPSLNGVADAIETGVPLIRELDTMAVASEVGAIERAGMDDSTLTLAGTPTAGIVDSPGMTADVGTTGVGTTDVGMTGVGTPDSDVSTGPGTLKPMLLRIPLIVAEVSGWEEKP